MPDLVWPLIRTGKPAAQLLQAGEPDCIYYATMPRQVQLIAAGAASIDTSMTQLVLDPPAALLQADLWRAALSETPPRSTARRP